MRLMRQSDSTTKLCHRQNLNRSFRSTCKYDTMSTEIGVDPYALLGVDDKETDLDKVTSAFRSLVLLVHPDKGGSASDLRVVTCAYAFVKRSLQDKANAETDFEAFVKDWKDSKARALIGEEDLNVNVNPFDNEAFEAEGEEMPVYVGPEGPDVGGAVAMAAGRGGHLGYTSEAIPIQPCMELIDYNASYNRPSMRYRPRVDLDLYDYAQAYAPPPEHPTNTYEPDTMAAFNRAVAERDTALDNVVWYSPQPPPQGLMDAERDVEDAVFMADAIANDNFFM